MGYRAPAPRARPDFVVDRRGVARAGGSVSRWTRPGQFAAAALALVMAAPTGSLGDGPQALSLAAGAAVRDYLAARSPGTRLRADMSKGKVMRAAPRRPVRPATRRPPVAAAPAPPVLQTLLGPPPPPVPLSFLDVPFEPGAMDFSALAPPLIEDDLACLCDFRFERPIGPGILLLSPSGGGLVPPPGGLLPPGTGGTPPAPPGIPEPNAWGMMILGFAVIGTMWRRRRALVHLILETGLLRLEFSTPASQAGSISPGTISARRRSRAPGPDPSPHCFAGG